MVKLGILCLLSYGWIVSEAYKILVVFPIPGKSHGILGDGFVRHLLNAGHEVTHVTSFPNNNTNPNLHQIDVTGVDFPKHLLSIAAIVNGEDRLTDINEILKLTAKLSKSVVMHKNVQNLINDETQEFDAVIVEWMYTEIYAGFSTVFNCPLIWFSSVEPHWMVLQLIDEPSNFAYSPDAFSTFIPPFTFYGRVHSLVKGIHMFAMKYFHITPLETATYVESFGLAVEKRGRTLPPYEEVIMNGSLLLTNSHVSIGQSIKSPQNCKAIGGYHINDERTPLPKDLQKIMDEAKNGVIYFSMGTNWKSKDMPDILKRDILKVMGELKQTVLWKFEEHLNNLPKNVHILNWAPQQSILAHPNCRLFVTHSGLLSTTETIHFGVPIVTIPLGADQFLNAQRAVQMGFARKIDVSYSMAGELKHAILEVLENPRYDRRAKELSFIYHDRVVPPGKELVHWVEHVIKTKGAAHWRSPALMVPWYQKMYIDLALVILICFIVVKIAFEKLLSCLTFDKNIKQKLG